MMPRDTLVQVLNRYLRGPDEDFADGHDAAKAIIPQVEEYAARHSIALDAGWKVDVARLVKSRLLKAGAASVALQQIETWAALFNAILTSAAELETA